MGCLIVLIESLIIIMCIGATVQKAANHLREDYIKTRFLYTPNEWPPYHPKHYTTLAFIHHKGRCSNTEVISVAGGMVVEGNLSKNQSLSGNISYHSKDITGLFPNNSESYFLLIEGAPGIGKTVLSTEIAYQWAENKLLKCKELVLLLFLRDPNIRHLSSVKSLIHYLFEKLENTDSKMALDLSKYLIQNKGKGLTIIVDGYDEMSEKDRNNSLIAKLISRTVLPQCDLVITSRLSASLHLRDMANCRVEVLGFTEEDRLDYIQHALEGSDDRIDALQSYLKSNSTINALCYIPLNMTILLCLFEEMKSMPCNTYHLDSKEENGLPNTQTEMYEKFILMTIKHFIKKNNPVFEGKSLLKISELPKPYNEAFNELLQLAFYALTEDKIVFSFKDQILKACPILKTGNLEGLGLLKVTEYVSTTSFHFLHFSIQEYLAAYYISLQPDSFQLHLLKTTFWDICYFNTWIMYVGITGGEKVAWKHFISGNWLMIFTKVSKPLKICKKYLHNKVKSLHLFQCFAETGHKESVKIFEDKIIDLSHQTLLPKDINTICFFLLRSVNKHWIKLDLSCCNIERTGCDILCETFLDKNRHIVSIDEVDFSHNQLRTHSILKLLDIFKVWHTLEAIVSSSCDNDRNLFEVCLSKFLLHIDENFSQRVFIGTFLFAHNTDIHNQLINSVENITSLYLHHCNYPSSSLVCKWPNYKLNLSKLHIIGENINSYFIGAIVQTMEEVDNVYIYDHTLSDEDVKYISRMLARINSSKSGLWVVIGGTKIVGSIPNICALNKWLSHVEIFNLLDGIKSLCCNSNTSTGKFNKHHDVLETKAPFFEVFFNLWQKNTSNCEIDFCLLENNVLITNRIKYDIIQRIISSSHHLVSVFIRKCELTATESKEFLDLISQQKLLERLYLYVSSLKMHIFDYENLLNQALKLKELFIHNTGSSCTSTFDLLAAQRDYPNMSILLIANNTMIGLNPTSEQLLLFLQLEESSKSFKFCGFLTNIKLFQQMRGTLSNIDELNILGCNFGEASANKVFQDLAIPNLSKLKISHNEISERESDNIISFLSTISKLEELDLSYNNLEVSKTIKILNKIQNASSLTKLNISNNCLDDEVAHGIADLLSHNRQLEELDLSGNTLQAIGVIKISKEIRNLKCLTILNIGDNNITDDAANNLAVDLFENNSLKELDLSFNNLGHSGSWQIFRGMRKVSNLIKLNVCGIGITKDATNDIAVVLNKNKELRELDLSHNNIEAAGATHIFNTSAENLRKFNISHNNITNDVDYIEFFFCRNTELEELDLSHNSLQSAGAIKVCKANLVKLTKFNISHNNITNEAADYIGCFLSHTAKLKVLDLSGNSLQELGFIKIFKSSDIITDLNLLKITHSYNIISRAAYELAALLLHNEFLEELDLSYNNLSSSDVMKIFNGMVIISNFRMVNVSHNFITDEAADTLANILAHNTKLKVINVSYNNLSTVGIVKVIKGMQNSINLETVNVSHNMITNKAVDELGAALSHNSNLKSLDLSSNYLTFEGFIRIFEFLKNMMHLRKLYISYNNTSDLDIGSTATVGFDNSKLEELDLSNNFMQTAGTVAIMRNFKQISSLKKLYINGNMITDEATDDIAAILSQSTKLEELNLSCNNLHVAGAITIFKSLRSIYSLKRLYINNNMITDKAADDIATVLSQNLKLEELNIGCNNLHAAGTVIIFKSLKFILNLKKLFINNNIITDEAADDIAAVLSQSTKLEEFDISCNYLQTGGANKIFQGIKHIPTLIKLNIAQSMITNGATVCITDCLSSNNNLKELNLSYINLKDLIALKNVKLTNLTKFNFSNNNIDKQLASRLSFFLSHCTNLQVLDLSCTNLQVAGGIEIFNVLEIVNLKELNVSGNGIETYVANKIANFLSKSDKLEVLDLNSNSLEELGIKNVLDSTNILNLHKLKIGNNINYTTDQDLICIADILIHATKLVELDLSYNKLKCINCTRYLLYKIQDVFTNLIRLNASGGIISDEVAEAFAEALSENTKLKELDLSDNNLHEEGINKIFDGLKVSTLLKLNISNNNITHKAAEYIATFLSRNTNLEELDISYNNLLSAGAIKICSTDISSLITFNISHNYIMVEAANDIATFLSQNTKLRVAGLSYSYLHGCVFKVLQNVSIITSLKIRNCSVVNEVADELSAALLHNISLRELDLSYNNLSTSDAVKIFKAMKNIITLKVVNLVHNLLTDEAADDLAIIISQNTKLEELDVSCNNLQITGTIKIFQAISHLSTLRKFNIAHNVVTDEAIHYLSSNIKLKELNLSHVNLDNPITLKHCKFTSLNKFNLSNNNISMQSANDISLFLSQCSNLQVLDLSYTNLQSPGGIEVLDWPGNFNLTKFNISGNGITTNAAGKIVKFLSKNNVGLEELDLSSNKFQELGINYILSSINISNLSKLNVCNILNSDDNQVSSDLICITDTLINATKLIELDLSYNKLSASCTRYLLHKTLSMFTNLVQLNASGGIISDEVAEALAYALSENTTLKELDLSDNNLHEKGIKKIFNGLKVSTLIKFNISHNNITVPAADYIASFISKNTELELLDLSYNTLLSAGAIKVCSRNLSSLTTFNISHNGVSAKAANIIAAFLSYNIMLQVLDLSCNDLQASDYKSIFKALQKKCFLTTLKLSNCSVINEAADELTAILLHNVSLQVLDLSYNKLPTLDAVKIFRAMKNISNLETVNIDHNIVADEVADELATTLSHNHNLQTLNISYGCVKSKDCIRIFNGLSNNYCLKKLDISYNNITVEASDSIATFLSHSVKLEELNISYNYLQTPGAIKILQHIKDISALKKLNMAHNMITEETTKHITNILCSNSKLNEINISYNNPLEIDMITKLIISGDKKLALVVTNIKELDLSNLDLSITAMEVFKEIDNITTVTKFIFSGNSIASSAAKYLVYFLSKNNELQELNLSHNDLQETGISEIVGAINISNLTKLNIRNNNINLKAIAEVLSCITKLIELDLSNNMLHDSADAASFFSKLFFINLIKLNMSGICCEFSDVAAAALVHALSQNNRLIELDISNNNLYSNAVIKIFSKLTISTLIKLNISNNNITTDQAAGSIANFLSKNTKLEHLDLSHSNLPSAGAAKIAKTNLMNLTTLNISHNYIATEAACHISNSLSLNTKIRFLDLSCSNLQESASIAMFKALQHTCVLSTLKISNCNIVSKATDELASVLLYNVSLKEIDLSCNNLSKYDSLNILKGLKNTSSLVAINLSHNKITDKAADQLENILFCNSKLEQVYLSYNNLSTSDTIKIFKGMKNTSNLVAIDVSHNIITDKAAETISTVLLQNNELTFFDISFNYFTSKGIARILECLRSIMYIRKLSVSGNEIGTKAANCISSVLSHNLKLEELDLSNNSMQTASTVMIFKSLQCVSSLKKIFINNNIITDEAANDIAAVLSQSTKLEELNISCNHLQAGGVVKIFQGIKHISTLKKLNIAHNMITDGATECIMDCISRNSNLKELNLSCTNLKSRMAFENLKLTSLTSFSFSNNNIDKQLANKLSPFLSHCTNLQVLDLSYTNLQVEGSIEVFHGLEIINLKHLNISGNDITTYGASKIAKFISKSNKLKELDLNSNRLQELGIKNIFKSANVSNLHKLNIHNSINSNLTNDQITSDLICLADIFTHAINLAELNLSKNQLNVNCTKYLLHKIKNVFTNLVRLNASGGIISDEVAETLVAALSENTKLEELDLSNNNLQEEGIIKIFNGLKMSTLLKLNISNNNITDQAADHIATFLSKNTKLEELDVSYNNMPSVGVIKVCRVNLSSLTTFNISNNHITAEAANDIAAHLSHNINLQVIGLSRINLQQLDYRCIFREMQNVSIITSLNFSNCSVVNEAADDLATTLFHNDLLREIDLSYNNLSTLNTVQIFKGMRNTTSLIMLNVSHNMITDEAAGSIATVLSFNNNLQVLDMSANHLGSQGCTEVFNGLKNTLNLRKLDISCNKITAEAATSVAEILGLNMKLEMFDISYNKLQTQGTIKIFKAIEHISTLKKVNIAHNMISSEATVYISNVLCSNSGLRELDLRDNVLLETDVIMKTINLMIINNLSDEKINKKLSVIITNLKELNLSNINLQTTRAIGVLKGLDNISKLNKFNISGNSITSFAANDLAEFLSRNTELQEIDVSYNNLQETGISRILGAINISKLTKLNISTNNANLKFIVELLVYSTKLIDLDFSNNTLNDSLDATLIFSELKNIFINLMKLNMSGICNKFSDEVVNALAHVLPLNMKLIELDLSNNNLYSEGVIKIFSEMNTSTLIKLSISNNNITDQAADTIATFISRNTELKELDLSHNNLKSEGALKVAKANIINLTNFNVSHNSITQLAAKDIAIFLSYNTKLKVLDFSVNDIHESGCTIIFEVLQNISMLTSLSISDCSVISNAANKLATFLLYNTNLQELILSHNKLSTSDTVKIFKGMKNISNLEMINISHNMITDEASDSIATVLSHNNNLQILNMSFNCLKSKGCIKVFSGMKNILHLRKLDISSNSINYEATDSIAAVLSQNTKLEELDISYNDLQTLGAVTIFEGIKQTSTLTKLNIAHNMITSDSEATEYIIDVLCNNNALNHLVLSGNALLEMDVIVRIIIVLSVTNLNDSQLVSEQATSRLSLIVTNLQELNLSNINLQEAGTIKVFKGLCNISTLKKFNISRNSITSFAANVLAEFLSRNSDLQELDLSYNCLQDVGAIKICEANISSLISFNISHNNITIKAADKIAKFLSHNSQMKNFDLSCNGLLELSVVNILKEMQVYKSMFNITELNISNASVINEAIDELIILLHYNTELRKLGFSCINLSTSNTVKIFQEIKNVSNLMALDISRNNISDGAANELAISLLYCTKLKEINLSCSNLSTSNATKIFKGMKNIANLIAIDLSDNMITDEVADELAIVLFHNNSLQIFNLSSNYLTSKGCVKVMNGMNNILYLKKLDISENQITCEAADSIASFLSHSIELEELVLSSNNLCTACLFKRIKTTKLTKLYIGNNNFTHLATGDIAAALMHNSELEEVDMSGNKFLSDGVLTIFNGMKDILNLKRFNFSQNGITCRAADNIANVLSHNINLQELYLSNNDLQSSGIISLLSRMNNITKMTHLDLSSNNITAKAADNIGIFLRHNDNLIVLDLSKNLIQTTGIRTIFGATNMSYNLRQLNLSGNMLNDEVASVIAMLLLQIPLLEELDLSENSFKAIGAVTVFKAIQSCPRILKLNMSNNNITDEAGDDIANVLSTTTTLREVDLDCNMLNVNVSNCILRAFIKLSSDYLEVEDLYPDMCFDN